ncbi:MAG TPA: hypothetical protein VGM94_16880 [Galbitalea sp.]|jgi:hypothetical protein
MTAGHAAAGAVTAGHAAAGPAAARLLRALVLVLLVGLALAGCSAAQKPQPERSPFAGQWTFTGGRDARGVLTVGDIPSGLTIGSGTSVIARGPCRDYSLDLFGQPGAVFVKVRHVSFGVCDAPTANQLDTRLLAALRATTFAEVDNRILTLRSRRTTLDFKAAPPVNMSALLHTSWMTEDTVMTQSGNILTVDATLRFPTERTLTLSIADCAVTTARMRVEAGYIQLSSVQNGDVGCQAAQSTGIHAGLVDLLTGGFTFSGVPGGLFITNPRLEETVRFTS